MKTKKINFFTYTPKYNKTKTIVLKGVRGSFTEQEVKEDITNLNIQDITVTNVTKLIFNKNDPDKYHFIVHLSNESNIKNLLSIKSILYQRIKWEKLRRKPIFQCRKCQRVGYASANCQLEYRCVKCAENHEQGKCPITENSSADNLKCANCNEKGHPASYRGCPFLVTALNLKKQHNQARYDTTPRRYIQKTNLVQNTCYVKTNNFVNPNISYRNILTNQHTNTTQSNDNHTPNTSANEVNNHTFNRHQQEETPFNIQAFLLNFTNSLMEKITMQLSEFETKLNKNKESIDFLFNLMFDNDK